RDYILDLFEELTGARIYHMYIVPGGVRNVLPDGWKERALEILKGTEKMMREVDRVMMNNAVFKARSKGLGFIPPDMVDPYGIVGPNARAAGFKRDLRKDEPYLVYDQLDFEVVTATASDAYERTWVRQQEIYQCIDLIRQMLDRMPDSGPFQARMPNVLHWKIPPGETYLKAECTRGEYGYYVVTDGSEYVRRVHVRGPSYTHAIAVMERLAVGTNIADIAGLMVSLHTYPPEIER
ncbi:MAG: NADH-quinone oxidoreductase subunit D, partial [Thiogranum sp.]